MATGVLILGVGKGTKSLQNFLTCTKGYEATVLFGGATDTYDITGKLLSKAPTSHITREQVEKALDAFRGDIMQKPPIYSALRIQGKRLYEYAREGKELPTEIQDRPVRVEEIEVVKWLDPGSHSYEMPKEEAEKEEKVIAEKVLDIGAVTSDAIAQDESLAIPGEKRKRDPTEEEDHLVIDNRPPAKRRESDAEHLMSGGLGPSEGDEIETECAAVDSHSPAKASAESNLPAVVLRMTVTSGFYVRSLCHDLGKALGSLGAMATLVRTRQGEFDLGRNVLEYDDLEKGEDEWGPKVTKMLDDWQNKPAFKENEKEEQDERDEAGS